MKKFNIMLEIDSYSKYNIFKRFIYRKIRKNFFYPEEIESTGSKFMFPNKNFKKDDLVMTYCSGCKKYRIMRLSWNQIKESLKNEKESFKLGFSNKIIKW